MARHRDKNLGEFEILVLTAVLRLATNAYGVAMRREIETRTGRSVSVGALYATLARLEEQGLVRSRLGPATPERGGRAKKFYELTAKGRQHLDFSLSALRNMTIGIYPWPEVSKCLLKTN